MVAQRFEGELDGVEPDQVRRCQRPHGVAEAADEDPVDVVRARRPRLDDLNGLVDGQHQNPVGDEAGRVLDQHPGLADPGQEVQRLAHRLGRGLRSRDHLHQRFGGGGVHEVDSDDPVRTADQPGQFGDRMSGRVGRDDRVGPAGLVEAREGGALRLDILRDVLDDEVDVCQRVEPGFVQ